jgi:alpha-beta hydrolase superfamily lysophospholipase
MKYVRSHSDCPDGKVFGLGHSMGGIILYAMLGTRGKNTRVHAGHPWFGRGSLVVVASMEVLVQ